MDGDREAIARRVEAEVGCRPPAALLDCWTGRTTTDPTVDVYLYGPGELAERNATYQIPTFRPDLLLVGDDGGGRGLLVARDDPDPDLVSIELGAVGSDDGERLGNLAALAAAAFRPVRDEEARRDALAPGLVDVVVDHRPAAGARALADVRRQLRLDLPLSRLTGGRARFPMVVLMGVRAAKYQRTVDDLNRRHDGFLVLRPHRP